MFNWKLAQFMQSLSWTCKKLSKWKNGSAASSWVSHCELIVLPKFHVLSFVRGIVSVFAVWLEQFPADFDDPPKYLSLNRMLHFVTSEVKENHRDELTKKIKHRLDKFRITPYEDEGKTLCDLNLWTEKKIGVVMKTSSQTSPSPQVCLWKSDHRGLFREEVQTHLLCIQYPSYV